jgi:Trk K+ transport system NAD-binding subunit
LEETTYNTILESLNPQTQKEDGNFLTRMIGKYFEDKKIIRKVRSTLRQNNLSRNDVTKVTDLLKNEVSLNNRIERLLTMQKLFRYWHVAHLPFAIIMLIIMIIHVGITLAFGYTWIF